MNDRIIDIVGIPSETSLAGNSLDINRIMKQAAALVYKAPTLISAGTAKQLAAGIRHIVQPGAAVTTLLTIPKLPNPGSEFMIRNRGGGTIKIDPQGATLEGVRSQYTMSTTTICIKVYSALEFYVVEGG